MKKFLLYGIPKSFLLKIIIALLIIMGCKNVFAQEINITNKIKATTSSSSGTYKGLEIYNSGTENSYYTNTRYTGQLSRIRFYLNNNDWDWNYNTTYTITFNMATEDWRNHFMGPQVFSADSSGNVSSSAINMYKTNTFQFVSYKKIKFNFTTPSSMGIYTYFNIYSTNISNTPFTGVSNWNLSSVVISTTTATPTPTPVSTPTPTPTSNQDIINNQNSNTQSIIDSASTNAQSIIDNSISNTSDIIENNNANTDKIVDELNKCRDSYNLLPTEGLTLSTGNGLRIEPYYQNGYLRYVYVGGTSTATTWYYLTSTNWNYTTTDDLYIQGTRNDVQVYCEDTGGTRYNNTTIPSGTTIKYCTLRIPSGLNAATYIYPMLRKTTSPSSYEPYGLRYCTSVFDNIDLGLSTLSSHMLITQANIVNSVDSMNSAVSGAVVGAQQGIINNQNTNQQQTNQKLDDIKTQQQQTNQKLDEVKNTISSDNIDNGVGSNFFNDFSSQDNGGISGIITKPLVLINSLLSNNNSCNSLTFGIKFPNIENKNVSFPSGCILWNNVPNTVVNLYQIIVVGFCSYYLLRRLFKDVEDLKNPEKDNVEVIDL